MAIIAGLARKILNKKHEQEPKAPKETYVQQTPAKQRVPCGRTERPPHRERACHREGRRQPCSRAHRSRLPTALDDVKQRQLKMARESLNDQEGKQIRKDLLDKKSLAAAQQQDPQKLKTYKFDSEQDLRYVELLSKHLDGWV